ncbi:MAG: CoA transferase subunit A [Dethiobacter sp.]|nr:CoA transferase subunit A [Dethiobacter sp.]
MQQAEETEKGRLFMDPDVDKAREFFRHKTRQMRDKVITVQKAVQELIHDGDYIAVGGFGTNRIPAAVLHEIVRQRKKNLGLSGHTATHDMQVLAAGDCVDRCDVAYVVGLEARGLSKVARRAYETGKIKAVEWSNGALAWRYKAAAMGIPFLPARVMLGTDTAKYSAMKEIPCPYTGIKLAALPALYPDVGIIHVHRADVYGNSQIDGIIVSDQDMARAAKRLIITAERLIPHEEIRRQPDRTAIPFYCVDAVIEVPYGSYPGNMAYEYFSDEEHLREWLDAEKTEAAHQEFMDKYIYKTKDFNEYLELSGGLKKMPRLRRLELLINGESSG